MLERLKPLIYLDFKQKNRSEKAAVLGGVLSGLD